MLPTIGVPFFGTISTYGLVLALYFVVAVPLFVRLSEREGIAPRLALGAFLVGVPAGILGARLLDIFEYADRYRSVADLFGRKGSSIYGGLILDLAVTATYARIVGIPLLRFLDAGAPVIALGEAASRIGCFLNGCCYGIEWDGPWALTFPQDSFAFHDQVRRGLISQGAALTLPVHPVQLYSAAASLIAAVWLARKSRIHAHAGATFATFLLFYGILRLAAAPLRVEALASMKALSVAFVAAGLMLQLWVRGLRTSESVKVGC